MSRSLVRLRRAARWPARALVPRVEVCARRAVLPALCTPAPHPCCVWCAQECGAGAVPLSAAARCAGRRCSAVRRWARPCCCRCGDGARPAPKPRRPHHWARRAQVSRSWAAAACAATCCWQRAARRARGRGARWWARCWSLRAGRSKKIRSSRMMRVILAQGPASESLCCCCYFIYVARYLMAVVAAPWLWPRAVARGSSTRDSHAADDARRARQLGARSDDCR